MRMEVIIGTQFLSNVVRLEAGGGEEGYGLEVIVFDGLDIGGEGGKRGGGPGPKLCSFLFFPTP